ncbi:hypothetical protein ADIS_3599 [Lunatimonas lonarensis]|uniref:Uncharacterized protein n=1 Tax=Lunatimonas lonarensis TaxID=1232681 RepID=R7ZPF3_9BACT|nr:hypothetical protein ADIS_3599 [Lunatimonas lonarensis]
MNYIFNNVKSNIKYSATLLQTTDQLILSKTQNYHLWRKL